MTDRIRLPWDRRPEGLPRVDLQVVRDSYLNFAKAMPDSRVYYAVRQTRSGGAQLLADSAPFDASLQRSSSPRRRRHARPHLVRQHDQKERDRAAYSGRHLFTPDCEEEVEGRGRARLEGLLRIHCDGAAPDWPLSRKFGARGLAIATWSTPTASASTPTACRSTSARSSAAPGLGRGFRLTAEIFRTLPIAASSSHGQPRLWLPGEVSKQSR
jgi:ornithine decarboxylase